MLAFGDVNAPLYGPVSLGETWRARIGLMLVATYLFAWNPCLELAELPADIRRPARRGFVDTEGSSARARNLEPDSRAFLVHRHGAEGHLRRGR